MREEGGRPVDPTTNTAYMLAHPEYRYLIGPVSISNRFSPVSKAVMVEYLTRNFFNAELAAYSSELAARPQLVVLNKADLFESAGAGDDIVVTAGLRIGNEARSQFPRGLLIGRIVDGSRFEEYKALYGSSLVVGWASIHGFAIGVIANQQGVIFSEEAQKATEFIQLCNRYDTPLLFIHGFLVNGDLWRNVVPLLADRHRNVTVATPLVDVPSLTLYVNWSVPTKSLRGA